MRELSLHILDVAENGIAAGADTIIIRVEERPSEDRLTIVVQDNGHGMPQEKIRGIEDPFVTTRTTRRVGLGLSLLAAGARRCGGGVTVRSESGEGAEVTAVFQHSHIDRAPLGDIAGTLSTLIVGNPHIDFVYTYSVEERVFILDTRRLKSEGVTLSDPLAVADLQEILRRSHAQVAGETDAQKLKEATHAQTDR